MPTSEIVERLREYSRNMGGTPEDYLAWQAADKIEHLQGIVASLNADLLTAEANIERLRLTPQEAYLQIVEGWLRGNRGIHFPEGAVDDLCKWISRALEPKP